jgi:hypothetical protein
METSKCGALFLFVEVQLQTGEDLSGTGGRTWPQIDYTHRTYLRSIVLRSGIVENSAVRDHPGGLMKFPNIVVTRVVAQPGCQQSVVLEKNDPRRSWDPRIFLHPLKVPSEMESPPSQHNNTNQ